MASFMTAPDERVPGRWDLSSSSFAFLAAAEDIVCHGLRPRDGTDPVARPVFIAGALPFDRTRAGHFFVPEEVRRGRGLVRREMAAGTAAPPVLSIEPRPSPADYGRAVARALAALEGAAGLRKVVLARSLRLLAAEPFDPAWILRRLARDGAATAFGVALPARAGQPRRLVGASPELLIEKRGTRVLSHPLAGSARRDRDPALDRAAAEGLARSDKDRREHELVVEAILDTLAPWCRDLAAPKVGDLISTDSMWHLGTRIEGTLKVPEAPLLDLVRALHPTPAVCGTPRAEAARLIADLEGFERDFFAGAVGYVDEAGDGRWMVSIRCAEIAGAAAVLYAGAGIVPGSDPVAEIAETAAKFRAMLDALDLDRKEV
ncbi:isochorismate synthase [Zavarzinia compransoris]|uniref:isochorismate synthase n=1 Tax=Zavarzinia compransoris TaxID=1264899 RepID=A0A317DVC5_9PROT|nr:isochorismate synthase [Zavarzinia compransoris]PWR17826.1 isochorismate synthase [Zavarzinia compransoris]TDP49359.1 isochorismate synthase [Zavarzinia compransoris]